MSSSPFTLSQIGGPWARRLAPRRAWIDELPWHEAPLAGDRLDARAVWTRTAFSEYASAAAFAEIGSALLAAAAPIDLVAAAGDFVVDEIVHTEAAARLAAALGGALSLEVDLCKLVRPARTEDALLRAAELIVRTCCVGEALTVSVLKVSRRHAGSPLFEAAIGHILADESAHAQLGYWFLDWADGQLSDAARDHLGQVAGDTLSDFAPLFGDCSGTESGLGLLGCGAYDAAFSDAVTRRVIAPLGERGILVPNRAYGPSKGEPATPCPA